MIAEPVSIGAAVGRVLADGVAASKDQPPFAASAMDGWAVRHQDAGGPLQVVGESAAGHPFACALQPGEAVRIGTGAVLPEGADHVLIQEDAALDGDRLTATAEQPLRANVRAPGRDFHAGQELLSAGTQIVARHLGLLAALGRTDISVVRRPTVLVVTAGDELRDPGATLDPGQIYDSASVGLPALIDEWGAQGSWHGRAPDDLRACVSVWNALEAASLIVTVGGASVGDRDLLRASLAQSGGQVDWAGVAIRPGKPAWGGTTSRGIPVLGLPGNPGAALVTARLLLKPALTTMLGQGSADPTRIGQVAEPMPANGWREAHERACVSHDGGIVSLSPVADGDSSRLSPFAYADALIERAPNAAPLESGATVRYRVI